MCAAAVPGVRLRGSSMAARLPRCAPVNPHALPLSMCALPAWPCDVMQACEELRRQEADAHAEEMQAHVEVEAALQRRVEELQVGHQGCKAFV